MEIVIKQSKALKRILSLMLAVIMVLSCGVVQVFADTITQGEWTIDNDSTPKTATVTIKNTKFTYYGPKTDFKYGTYGTFNYVQSTNDNGSASNGIVTTSGKGYGEFKATEAGTLTILMAVASNKTGYISKVDSSGKAEALGSFAPGGVAVSEDSFKVTQGSSYATIDIEVEAGSTYYVCLSGSKMKLYGVSFVPYTTVIGKIDNSVGATGYGIKFTSPDGKVKEATVDTSANTYSISLKPNIEYSVSLTGSAAGNYSITNATRLVTPKGDSMTADLALEKSLNYTVSGSIVGFDEGYDLTDLTLKFVPSDTNSFATVDVEIDKTNKTFSALLTANVEYNLVQGCAYDYELSKEIKLNKASTETVNVDAEFKKVATYDVNGGFLVLGELRGEYKTVNADVKAIKFTNIDDKYEYSLTATESGFSGKLRNGSYQASITCDDYSTSTHIVVDGKATSKDMLLKPKKAEAIAYAPVIYVGADKEYKTVQAAVDAVSLMTRDSSQAVTIKIDPAIYREQLYVTAPNITLESNGGNRDNTKISWYYGIGYKYYSTVNSLYDPYADYDKFEKGDVIKYWGSAVVVDAKAEGFSAENIGFENSFNKYMTEEELNDGVELNGLEKNTTTVRKENTKVEAKSATERAAALVNYADKTEFLNCSFVSSQDTLYTCNRVFKAYYKNCYIEGMTDYIYGNGDVIFDGCELNFCGYSDAEASGYITAQSSSADYLANQGYVFRNCIITANKDRKVGAGYLGRMWGKCATVNFINTQLEDKGLVIEAGWGAMSGVEPTADTVNLKEYNTTYNGEKIDTANRVSGVVNSIDLDYYSVEKAFIENGWTPKYYTAVSGTPSFDEERIPSLKSNGDLNIPNPGETVTVSYALNDDVASGSASRVSWYAVDTDYDGTSLDTILEKATLLYTTADYVSKSLQIPMECAGKYLMVVVTPIVIGGNSEGTPKYAMANENVVSDTWVNPDKPNEIAPGSGINVFLAGDSTVMDYSAEGMHNSGKVRQEGSWGEFIQYYFDENKVQVNNYAKGGRSTRNFLNEGFLASIKKNIKKGDYLLIQFGHNDCANDKSYYEDRFVPLYAQPNGTDVVNGVYPTIVPDDVSGNTKYSWNSGPTYKGYLQAYINVALEVGATPIVVSPVARMYYTDDGKIKTHHDATKTDYEPTATYLTSNDAYVTACKQIVEENVAKGKNVLYLDAFSLTKNLFEEAWADCSSNANGAAMMNRTPEKLDTTHCNKTGGFIEAGLIAKWLKNANISVSEFVQAPTTVYGETPDGKYIITVKDKKVTAKDNYYKVSEYWTKYAQAILDELDYTEPEAPADSVFGDANNDGVITIEDSAELMKYVLSNDYNLAIKSNAAWKSILDVDKDKKITATDATYIEKKAKNSSYLMPVEK